MNIRFASVDVVQVQKGDQSEFKIIEVNSGVMMTHLAEKDEEKVLKIYEQALTKMLQPQ